MMALPVLWFVFLAHIVGLGGVRDQHIPIRTPKVTLDCYYNNEWKIDSSGRRWQYHYVWSDTLDSGYSQLGALIVAAGGTLDTLHHAPSESNLSTTDIYLIVDPDTPKETEHPAYIEDSSSTVISRWVYHGGILMLFGNDSGNAEFTHLNGLAGHFGIHFNQTSRNRVVGKDYAAGTFAHLPDHPIFHAVRKIYLKEISTLSITAPAIPVLVDGADVIIAIAEYGKGLVFAVGDPWFYNEYMDHRKLPIEYDNARTAKNLFRWLLQRIDRHGVR
jgi:unsaturated rhamnogalacturonyl hydrolase